MASRDWGSSPLVVVDVGDGETVVEVELPFRGRMKAETPRETVSRYAGFGSTLNAVAKAGTGKGLNLPYRLLSATSSCLDRTNVNDSRATQPDLGRLAVYVFFEATFVGGLVFRADSTLGYVVNSVLSIAGAFAILAWFRERRETARRAVRNDRDATP